MAQPPATLPARALRAASVFRQVPGTFRLLWDASPGGTVLLAVLAAIGALIPAATAYVGKLIIDGVVTAAASGRPDDRARVLTWVALECALTAASTLVVRLEGYLRQVTGARLTNVLAERILAKALELELKHFEDSEVHDKMQNARREASARPLSLILKAFSVAQNTITLGAYAALVVSLSPWSIVILLLASIPSFVKEVRLAGESFTMNLWRAPDGRRLNYLEYILTRDSHVKEVKLFDLGELFLGRFRALFQKFFAEDTRLARRRMLWGTGLGFLSLAAFYACYGWVAGRAARAEISLGDMSLYLVVFRQGQSAFLGILTAIGAMYEDALFMSNLFTFLAIPTTAERARVEPPRTVPRGAPSVEGRSGPGSALELRNVSFRYPGKEAWALRDLSLVIRPGEKVALVGENGAGKSTVVKLLMRLYAPNEGEILYGGVDIRDMDPRDLRGRIGAVFQDAVRFQLAIRENIGLGDAPRLQDRERIEVAAQRGGADAVAAALPQGYDTVLGGWFERGQELSGGQWQKVAVSRGFMRDAEVLILDEPAASIDAEAEAELFARLKALTENRIAIVISHRFSTVRIADRIAVLHQGSLVELGSHDDLLALDGRYAHLFRLQARGYR